MKKSPRQPVSPLMNRLSSHIAGALRRLYAV